MSICVVLVGTGWGAAWYIARTVTYFDEGRKALQYDVDAIRQSMALADADKYTLTAASEKALRTAIENPGMRVPDPRNPNVIIEVRLPIPRAAP